MSEHMDHYSLDEAKNQLHQLISDARHGKMVLILDDDDGAVRLVPVVNQLKPRKAGSARGQIRMSPDFDAPLADFCD